MKTIEYPMIQSLQLITMPTIFPINCYIVLEDEFCTLIDCSKRGMATPIIAAIEQTKLPLNYIIITHAHSDHTGDLAKIKKHFPKAKICIGKQEFIDSERPVDNIRLPAKPDILLEEGDTIGSLRVIDTPGHTNGSISLIDTRSHTTYVGDLLQTRGGLSIAGDVRWLFPFPGKATIDKKTAIQSVKKLIANEQIATIFCGHGAAVSYARDTFQQIILRAEKNREKSS